MLVTFSWSSWKRQNKFFKQVEKKEVEYPITGNYYADESKNILEELGLEDEDDKEVEHRNDNDDDYIQVCECLFYWFHCIKYTIN